MRTLTVTTLLLTIFTCTCVAQDMNTSTKATFLQKAHDADTIVVRMPDDQVYTVTNANVTSLLAGIEVLTRTAPITRLPPGLNQIEFKLQQTHLLTVDFMAPGVLIDADAHLLYRMTPDSLALWNTWFSAQHLDTFKQQLESVTAAATAVEVENKRRDEAQPKVPYGTEVSFLITSVMETLVESLAMTNVSVIVTEQGPRSVLAPLPTYLITIQGLPSVLTYTQQISRPLDPASYLAIGTNLVQDLHIVKQKAAPLPSIAAKLAQADGVALERLNIEVSSKLTKDHLNPYLYDQAALLEARFALRERFGHWNDVRIPLSRLTACATVASVLGGTNCADAELADLSRLILLGYTAEGVNKLKQHTTQLNLDASWVAALQARATKDFRPLIDGLKTRSLLEVAECTLAGHSMVGAEPIARQLEGWVENQDTNLDVSAWEPFQGLFGDSVDSVAAGHMQGAAMLPLLLTDSVKVYSVNHKDLHFLETAEVPPALMFNQAPSGIVEAGSFNVLDWGQWAMQYQRSLLTAMRYRMEFLQKFLGASKEDIKQEAVQLDAFKDYWLAPFVNNNLTGRQDIERMQQGEFFEKHPELTPLLGCVMIDEATNRNSPARVGWLKYNPPAGVNCQVILRMTAGGLVEDYVGASGSDPYDLELISYMISRLKFAGKPIPSLTNLYGQMANYSVAAARTLAKDDKLGMTDRIRIFTNIATWYPEVYLTIKRELEPTGLAQAVTYYEKARAQETGVSAVSLANEAFSPMKYYLDTGETVKAKELASFCTRVFSAAGLEVATYYLIRTSKYNEALEVASAERDRYDCLDAVLNCRQLMLKYETNSTSTAAYTEEKLKVFPTGITAYIAQTNAPVTGFVVERAANNLIAGDIIVAITGKKVETLPQLRYFRLLASDWDYTKLYDITVWRDNKYQELKGNTFNIGLHKLTE